MNADFSFDFHFPLILLFRFGCDERSQMKNKLSANQLSTSTNMNFVVYSVEHRMIWNDSWPFMNIEY